MVLGEKIAAAHFLIADLSGMDKPPQSYGAAFQQRRGFFN